MTLLSFTGYSLTYALIIIGHPTFVKVFYGWKVTNTRFLGAKNPNSSGLSGLIATG
jgi:hypothetical protein